ncbi:MAG: hypothetical protein PUP93_19820 [Rhizonema sp. NSF051]|nr:hypothetical protein [Rhizonema sp. NSF051]
MINATAIDNYMTNSVPENLKEHLHKALGRLEPFEQCALLNYPNYPNIGDHLIGLSTLFYLTDVRKTNIKILRVLVTLKEFDSALSNASLKPCA